MVLDRAYRFGFAAGVVGDSSHRRELRQLALCAEIYSNHHRFSAVACGRYPRSTRLLDFSWRIDFTTALVRDCFGRYWTSTGRETDRPIRGTLMSFLAFFLIVVSLLSFVAAQLILKRAMEATTTTGFRNPQFVSKVTGGILLMTISFFLTLGVLQRFDLSSLFPFHGFSVIFIARMPPVVRNEMLNMR